MTTQRNEISSREIAIGVATAIFLASLMWLRHIIWPLTSDLGADANHAFVAVVVFLLSTLQVVALLFLHRRGHAKGIPHAIVTGFVMGVAFSLAFFARRTDHLALAVNLLATLLDILPIVAASVLLYLLRRLPTPHAIGGRG